MSESEKFDPTVAAHRGPRGTPASQLSRFLKIRMARVGLVILGTILVLSVASIWLLPFSYFEQFPGRELTPPSWPHVLGTDNFGRDILARTFAGVRLSVRVALISVSLAAIGGTAMGLVAGYLSTWIDSFLMRSTDVLLAFPTILVGLGLAAIFGPGSLSVTIAITSSMIPFFARLARAGTLEVKGREYVEVAVGLNVSKFRILMRHILPNTAPSLLVQLGIALPFAIIGEASLSFLGVGAQSPAASLGGMLGDGQTYIRIAPWMVIVPGVVLSLLVISMNLLTDAVRDLIDPSGTY